MSEQVRVKLADVPEATAVRVEGGRFGICLVRLGDDVYALADRCSHQSWPLSDGEVSPADGTIECTKHGSLFSLKDGRPQCLPATAPVEMYTATVEGDDIVVRLP